MNKNTMRLGYFASWGIIVLTILLIAGLILQFIVSNNSQEWRHAITSYCTRDTSGSLISYVCGFVYFLQTPMILVLFACFHDYAKSSRKIFSRISLSFIISYTTLCALCYIVQFKIDSFKMDVIDDCLLYLFHDSVSSVDSITNTAFLGLAELFIVPVFLIRTKTETNIGFTLFIAGIFNLTGALMFILDKSEIYGYCWFLSRVFFIIAVILLIKFFSLTSIKNQKRNV